MLLLLEQRRGELSDRFPKVRLRREEVSELCTCGLWVGELFRTASGGLSEVCIITEI